MPIYEYRCEHCGAVSDVKHAYKEQVELTCPTCGSHDLKRVFSAAGIVFKGSGFYINDSRGTSSSSSKPAASAKTDAPTDKASATDKAPAAEKKADAPKSGGSGDAAA